MSQQIVVMGVSGCGKSTLGEEIAQLIGAEFIDGDDLHSAENIAKMSSGQGLDDDDRAPWLSEVGSRLSQAAAADAPLVIACSALKRRYRDQIRAEAPNTFFVHPHGSRIVLLERLSKRTGHFMPVSLLDSQLEMLEPLEPDEAGIQVDMRWTVEGQVAAALG